MKDLMTTNPGFLDDMRNIIPCLTMEGWLLSTLLVLFYSVIAATSAYLYNNITKMWVMVRNRPPVFNQYSEVGGQNVTQPKSQPTAVYRHAQEFIQGYKRGRMSRPCLFISKCHCIQAPA